MYFNPRTHVGCDGHGDFGARHNVISIHAPTWGATLSQLLSFELLLISIHAPTWGATRADTKPDRNHKISIHAPTWGATVDDAIDVAHQRISIHAPTWGATSRTTRVESPSGFQSTHPRGVRPPWVVVWVISGAFQSTHPRGVRPDVGECCACAWAFQSTHPRGVRRRSKFKTEEDLAISIHAPTWGATQKFAVPLHCQQISIHAPTWGATYKNLQYLCTVNNFNPRTHVGCDEAEASDGMYKGVFQSTHPRGVRLQNAKLKSFHFYFNPRTHVGCDEEVVRDLARHGDFNPRTHVGCDSGVSSVSFG